MIDHISVQVTDYDRSKAFYLKALAPLGYGIVMEFGQDAAPGLAASMICGLGVGEEPDLWLVPTTATITSTHLAFRARSKSEVDAFHAAALEAGGKDNGAPGPRPHYHPGYYGAFVIDPDGYNVEAVIHNHG